MKKYLDVIEYSKSDRGVLYLLTYDEKSFIGYGCSDRPLELGEYNLICNSYQSPLFKTYSMRYPWFNYKGFLSIGDKYDIHAGNRNISNDTALIIGAQPSDLYQSPYVINSEKAMNNFYSNFFSIVTKEDIGIVVRVKSIT